MSPGDPSLLVAAAVVLDLIQDNVEHKNAKEEGTGLWVECLAWAILALAYWILPIVRRYAASYSLEAGLEEPIIFEKSLDGKSSARVLYILSFFLVGAGYLRQPEHGNYNWALVSRRRRCKRIQD
jgi:hypothetical protein